ncbi:uncharacterized protein LOC126891964 isoform X1 [Diabrotica virgifera virgifera]|uniref:Uncharacterized protein n=1 Tax=Diabrotica virgifera virgifera TaxID=50390 RepID=A0ABM5L4A8_DIAVI|nr:uncharacterized protein LOC126891964 isoform X1 [Diabrotica virgifera virgifera]
MQGKLKTKLKVIHTIRPAVTLFSKSRVKGKREPIAQRWSRRIRSLPPIPISMLSPGRKISKKVYSFPIKEEKEVAEKKIKTSLIVPIKKEKGSQKNNTSYHQKEEIVRIVPVIVYVKHNKTKLKSLADDLEIKINTKRVSAELNTTLSEKLKQECTNLEKKWSKRLKQFPTIWTSN